MAKDFIFSDLVNEFAVDFIVYEPGTGQYNTEGQWVEGTPTQKTVTGVVVPLGDDDLQFVGNGVYTEKTRKFCTTEPLGIGYNVEYKGQSYKISRKRPIDDYTDVFIYYGEGAD